MLVPALFGLAVSQTILVPGDQPTIQAAIDAASPGDVIVLAPGTFAPFTLDKSLTLTTFGGFSGGPVSEVVGGSLVTGVSEFSIVGLEFTTTSADQVPALEPENVTGRGRLDDCLFHSNSIGGQSFGLLIGNCEQLVITRSVIEGPGAALVILNQSLVSASECSISGTSSGSHGVLIYSSELLLSGGDVSGEDAPPLICGSAGGDAIAACNSEVTILGTTLSPGVGIPLCGIGSPGGHVADASLFGPFPGLPSCLANSSSFYLSGTCVDVLGQCYLHSGETSFPLLRILRFHVWPSVEPTSRGISVS